MLLGVDGGNSKTVAVLASADGAILGAGRGRCSDIYGSPSVESALHEIEVAVDAACARAGIPTSAIGHATFCLAGADWPEDIELLETELANRGLGARTSVWNDPFAALRAGSAGGTGVAVVVGTGAAIGARGRDGRAWHTSWWQEPQGSLHLAEKAFKAICRSEIGVEGPTSLTERALALYGAETVESLLHQRTRSEASSRPPLTALTPILLEEASLGDRTAADIVSAHGTALGDFALAAWKRVGEIGDTFRLVLSGGVLRSGADVLKRSLCERVLAQAPRARPVAPCYEPAIGALLLAFDAARITVDGSVESHLRASLPQPEVFRTNP